MPDPKPPETKPKTEDKPDPNSVVANALYELATNGRLTEERTHELRDVAGVPHPVDPAEENED